MMSFNDAAIAAKYMMTEEQDRKIVIHGQYSGLLSQVKDPAVLDGMIRRKSNLVALKDEKRPASGGAGSGSPK